MFREMRRNKKQMPMEEIIKIIKKAEYGILSTYGENEYPYALPVNYVYMNDCIYFHCAMEGHKLDNIRFHNKVSFCIIGDTEVVESKFSSNFESVVIYGKASEITDEEEKSSALYKLIEKYSPNFIKEGKELIYKAKNMTNVVKIKMDDIKGKKSNK